MLLFRNTHETLSIPGIRIIDMSILIEYNKSTKNSTVLVQQRGGKMTVVKQMDIRANIKKYFDLAFGGEPVIVSRKQNKNVVVISESEYNDLQKAKRNAEYLAELDRSFAQAERGETISFSIDELKAMESNNWKPTTKIMDFMKKATNE